jgi:indole-3-glycerol phosphate synthase
VADSSQKIASASAGKSSSSSGKKVIMKNYSRQGSSLFSITLDSRRFTISCL